MCTVILMSLNLYCVAKPQVGIMKGSRDLCHRTPWAKNVVESVTRDVTMPSDLLLDVNWTKNRIPQAQPM